MSCGDVLLAFVAFIFPPIAVWVKTGVCSVDSLLNLLLCLLGWIPGLIHAWYIIAKYPEHAYDAIEDPERGERVTYYYISHETAGRGHHGHHNHHHHHHGPSYGSFHGAPGNQVVAPPHHPHSSHQPPFQPPPGPPPQSRYQQQRAALMRNPSSNQNQDQNQNVQSGSGAGSSSAGPPPSYSEAVRGDHKIQRP